MNRKSENITPQLLVGKYKGLFALLTFPYPDNLLRYLRYNCSE